jgi:hypothetical protein
VPVGTIIIWSTWATPDASNGTWLECNGQYVNPSVYPKLAALMSYTPNYQGIFLRGYGSQYSYHYNTVLHSSANLGDLQGDAIRNIYGELTPNGVEGWPMTSGAINLQGQINQNGYGHNSGPVPVIDFDSSRVVPVANEDRPINRSVRYLIKAS